VSSGQKAVDNKEWSVYSRAAGSNSGQWVVKSGEWAVDNKELAVNSRQWAMDSGQYSKQWSWTQAKGDGHEALVLSNQTTSADLTFSWAIFGSFTK
jgi:hypothetical protein